MQVGAVRVGLLGLTTERKLVALGDWATEGIRFTGDAAEAPGHVAALREQGVDLVVLVSAFGLAKNVLVAERHPGIDVILSSDMHEETRKPVITSTATLVSEVGQDGTRLAQLDLTIGPGGGVRDWRHRLHTIDAQLPPDPEIEAAVTRVRSPFLGEGGRAGHRNPVSHAVLDRPIDDVVGRSAIGLYRSDFSHAPLPAVVAGSSSDFVSTAIREVAAVDVAQFRGFRYGTHVAPGLVRLEDLHCFLAVGPDRLDDRSWRGPAPEHRGVDRRQPEPGPVRLDRRVDPRLRRAPSPSTPPDGKGNAPSACRCSEAGRRSGRISMRRRSTDTPATGSRRRTR